MNKTRPHLIGELCQSPKYGISFEFQMTWGFGGMGAPQDLHTSYMCLDAFSVEKSFAYIFAMAKGAGTLLVSNKNRASLLFAALACGRRPAVRTGPGETQKKRLDGKTWYR